MASGEDLLIASFEAVKVPGPLTTGELDADAYVNSVKDSFIEEAVASLRLNDRAKRLLLNIDHGMIVPTSGRLAHTDDFYTRLQLVDTQTLVAIERNRDVLNYMVVQFAKFQLGTMAVRRILQYSEFGED